MCYHWQGCLELFINLEGSLLVGPVLACYILIIVSSIHMELSTIKTLLTDGQMTHGSVYRLALVHPQPTYPAPVVQFQFQVQVPLLSSTGSGVSLNHYQLQWSIHQYHFVSHHTVLGFCHTTIHLTLNIFCSRHLFVKFPFFIRRLLCSKFCFFLQLQISLTTTAGREWEKLLITIVTKHGPAITTPPK